MIRMIDATELKTAFPSGEYVRTECVQATIDHMQTIDAIPVEWLREFDLYYNGISGGTPFMNALVEAWKHVNLYSPKTERERPRWLVRFGWWLQTVGCSIMFGVKGWQTYINSEQKAHDVRT